MVTESDAGFPTFPSADSAPAVSQVPGTAGGFRYRRWVGSTLPQYTLDEPLDPRRDDVGPIADNE